MKKIKGLFIFIFIFSLINNPVFSQDNVFFIDLDLIIKQSEEGKKILDKIKQQNEENIQLLKKKEEELKLDENEINKKKNIISREEMDKEISSLKKKIKLFNSDREILVNNFNKLRETSLKEFFIKINPIIQEYMDEKSINILLDRKNVFIGRVDSDITDDIIEKINNKFN